MAIQFISVKCPECGADLSVENSREFAFCSYCGAKVMISNDNEHIYRTIDDAGIKQAETERMIRLREMELEEQETARNRKALTIAYGIALAFVIVGALLCLAKQYSGSFGILIGLYIALFTFIRSDGDKKKKKRRYVSPNEASITEVMKNYSGKSYNSIVALFNGAGFTNVTAVPLGDLNLFTMGKNGQVESVSINGSSGYEEGDVFPKDASVLITYHSR